MSSTSASGRGRLVVPVVVAVALALITAVLFVMPGAKDDASSRPGSSAAQPQAQGEPTDNPLADLARREPGDPMAVGKADAPVVMINYSEFQCPFCGKFARDTLVTGAGGCCQSTLSPRAEGAAGAACAGSASTHNTSAM